ncbi:MAG: c-type cytochrome [Terricaulis sp.]
MARLLTTFAAALALACATADLAAAQNATQGRAVFQANCAVCHMAVSNGHALVGPNLFGVVGRRAGSAPGFNYSPAMQHAGFSWSPAQLLAYVQAPAQTVPGNRMPFAGLHNPQQAAAVVAYLGTLH